MGNRHHDRSGPHPDYARPEPGRPYDQRGYERQGQSPDEGRAYPQQHATRSGSYPREGADNAGGFPRDTGFTREEGFGHVPGQRWSGGYGGDVDRGPQAMGQGFSGNDFGPSRPSGQRHFGNEVDRGGRVGPGGYGFQGTDMGMGAPADERGPHYGKGPKGYKRSDARIYDEVCEAIAHQGHIDASDVEVKVENGAVTLTGTVVYREDKRGLEHLVERQRGVDDVHNELRLKRPTPASAREHGASPGGMPAAAGDSTSANASQRNGKSARS